EACYDARPLLAASTATVWLSNHRMHCRQVADAASEGQLFASSASGSTRRPLGLLAWSQPLLLLLLLLMPLRLLTRAAALFLAPSRLSRQCHLRDSHNYTLYLSLSLAIPLWFWLSPAFLPEYILPFSALCCKYFPPAKHLLPL